MSTLVIILWTLIIFAVVYFVKKSKGTQPTGKAEEAEDYYEQEKQILGSLVLPQEGEVAVKQYKLARLRSRFAWFSYKKALGKLQITNKRLIFRSSGKSIGGKDAAQQEFDINDVSGVEIHKGFKFRFWDFLGAVLVAVAGGVVTRVMRFLLSLINTSNVESLYNILNILFIVALTVLTILLFIQMRSSIFTILALGALLEHFIEELGISFVEILINPSLIVNLLIFAVLPSILLIYLIIQFSQRPAFTLTVKTKFASEAIIVKESNLLSRLLGKGGFIRYAEIIPAIDAEKCMHEVNSLINSIKSSEYTAQSDSED